MELNRGMPRRAVMRGLAWLSVAAIAYLSLIPSTMEVRTGFAPGVEHLIAYTGSAALMTFAYPACSGWVMVSLFFAYSGALEILQTLSPGRHAELAGALWSGAGAAFGAAAARVMQIVSSRGPSSKRYKAATDEQRVLDELTAEERVRKQAVLELTAKLKAQRLARDAAKATEGPRADGTEQGHGTVTRS
jgi:hypothetical protein